jgi:hypothetical protein
MADSEKVGLISNSVCAHCGNHDYICPCEEKQKGPDIGHYIKHSRLTEEDMHRILREIRLVSNRGASAEFLAETIKRSFVRG